jgi:hypothetical protein
MLLGLVVGAQCLEQAQARAEFLQDSVLHENNASMRKGISLGIDFTSLVRLSVTVEPRTLAERMLVWRLRQRMCCAQDLFVQQQRNVWYACVKRGMCMCVHTYAHLCVHVSLSVYMYVCVSVCLHVCMCDMYVCTHDMYDMYHACTHVHMYEHMHIHTNSIRQKTDP